MFKYFLHHLLSLIVLILLLAGCNSSNSNSNSNYNYTYQESNSTPVELAATLFYALKSGDQALWDKYRLSTSEIKELNDTKSERRKMSEEQLQRIDTYLSDAMVQLREDFELKKGIIDPANMRFLRAYVAGSNYDVGEDTAPNVIVEFAYQDHYIGGFTFDELIKTDKGWVMGMLDGSRRNNIGIGDVIPLGIPSR